MMPEQLTYTPPAANVNEHPFTMVVLVDPAMLQKYRDGDTSIPLATIVDSFEIFKYDTPGKEGCLAHPSQAELQSAFDTTNETQIIEFMLAHGQLPGKYNNHRGKKGVPRTSHEVKAPALDQSHRAY